MRRLALSLSLLSLAVVVVTIVHGDVCVTSCATYTFADCVTDLKSYSHSPANSEQRVPLFIFQTPRDLVFNTGATQPWPPGLNTTGINELVQLPGWLGVDNGTTFYVEAWPIRDDWGQLTWSFARYSLSSYTPGQSLESWLWIDGSLVTPQSVGWTSPFAPNQYVPGSNASDFAAVFDDFLSMSDLYDKPVFGDCVFGYRLDSPPPLNTTVLSAWNDPSQKEAYAAYYTNGQYSDQVACYQLPQPARIYRGVPTTLILSVVAGETVGTMLCDVRSKGYEPSQAMTQCIPFVELDDTDEPEPELMVSAPPPSAASALPTRRVADIPILTDWPPNYEASYRDDIASLSGAQPAVWPVSGRTETFVRKEACDPTNQLLDVVSWLEEKYAVINQQSANGVTLTTRRQSFVWRDIPQANLIVRIPGTLPNASVTPVVMADHYDTAFDEDIFALNGSRVSAPGADDNDSAAATLLKMAEIMTSAGMPPPQYDIWLVHLTGEEFPGDDLGARALMGELLTTGQDIRGVVLMDMIGWRNQSIDDRIFQINPGSSLASQAIAQIALNVAPVTAPTWQPVLRPDGDPKSYLFNTDGVTIADTGYPVILINEHINIYENFGRSGYHMSDDTLALMDMEFATAVSKTAVATAAVLAGSVVP